MPLYQRPRIDVYRHLSFAAVGGFLGAYAILCRGNLLANAQTMNLFELVFVTLAGSWQKAALHLGSFLLYVASTVLTVVLSRKYHVDMRRVSPCVTAVMALVMGFLPMEMEFLPSVYPIVLATAVQWSSFNGAKGFSSSTIFSTNNVKQTSVSFAEFLCDGDKRHLERAWFFLSTLLCFYLGGAVGYFAIQVFSLRASWCVLPLLGLAYFLVTQEERAEKDGLLQPAHTNAGP